MKFSRSEMARAAKLLARLDEEFSEPARMSTIWRGDVRAVRYVLRKLMTEIGKATQATQAKRAMKNRHNLWELHT